MELSIVLERWLAWLDSEEGKACRLRAGQKGEELDLICVIPNPPGGAIVTVKDLREHVQWLKLRLIPEKPS